MKRLFLLVLTLMLGLSLAAQVKTAAGDVTGDGKDKKQPAKVQAKAEKKEMKAEAKIEKKEALLLDLNTASRDDLIKLPGIGEAYADKIIKNRPYANKTQVISRAGVPEAAYKKFEAKVIAKQK